MGDNVTTLKGDMVYSCEKLMSVEGGKNVTDIYRSVSDTGKLYTAFDIGYASENWKTATIIGEKDSGIVHLLKKTTFLI